MGSSCVRRDEIGKAEKGQELTEQVNSYIGDLQDELAQGHTTGYLETLDWYAKLHKYSWGNALLIMSQCPHATIVAGYKRWQELGFQVKKGETGLYIRAPWLRKELDENGEKKDRLIGYFATCVFDISQTAEYPDKQPPAFAQDVPGDFHELYAHLQHQLAVTGLGFEEIPLPTGYQGHYDTNRRAISINEAQSVYFKVTTLIHEYVHSLVHPTKEKAMEWTQDEREWQAESVCYVVCRAIGLESVNSRDYLLSYSLTTDRLAELMQFIQKTTKQVLADLDLLQPITAQSEALAAD